MGIRNACTIGVAPLHTTTTPGTGVGGEGPSGIGLSIPLCRTRRCWGANGDAFPHNQAIQPVVITFDAGQTLIELDLDFLAVRLRDRHVDVSPAALVAAEPAAWRHYDSITDTDHGTAWRALIGRLLDGAGVPDPAQHARWLWHENPRTNLFRRPIEGMVALSRELVARGAVVAVISNSEGGLADLLAEIGLADGFAAVIDSSRVGLEKPDPRIFAHTLAVLGATAAGAIHIGDSWDADIVGARGAGWRAIWYGRRAVPVDDPGVASASGPADARTALVRWGVL